MSCDSRPNEKKKTHNSQARKVKSGDGESANFLCVEMMMVLMMTMVRFVIINNTTRLAFCCVRSMDTYSHTRARIPVCRIRKIFLFVFLSISVLSNVSPLTSFASFTLACVTVCMNVSVYNSPVFIANRIYTECL